MSGEAGLGGEVARLRRMVEDQAFAIEGLGRQLDELLLRQRLADVAEVEAEGPAEARTAEARAEEAATVPAASSSSPTGPREVALL